MQSKKVVGRHVERQLLNKQHDGMSDVPASEADCIEIEEEKYFASKEKRKKNYLRKTIQC